MGIATTVDDRKIVHRNIRIEVSQANIDKSMPRDSQHCMIADALLDRVKHAKSISVDIATIRFTDKKLGKRFIFLTPLVAQQALVDFDQGKTISPFSFNLRTAIQVVSKRAPHSKPSTYEKKRIVLARNGPKSSYQPAVAIGGDVPPAAPLSSIGPGRLTARIRRFGARNLKP
jgi:hypothetical protein